MEREKERQTDKMSELCVFVYMCVCVREFVRVMGNYACTFLFDK